MASVGVRELKNNLSRYLRELRPGDVLSVTDRGRVIAEIRAHPITTRGATPASGGYARLVAAGVIRPATEGGDPLGGLTEKRSGVSHRTRGIVAELIREDRGE